MAYRFRVDESASEGIRRIAVEQLDRAIEHLEGRAGTDFDERIHEARKAMKRLRALVRLVRSGMGEEEFRRENACFRDAAARLAGMRDAAVLVDTLDRLVASAGRTIRKNRFAAVRRWLMARRGATEGASPAEEDQGVQRVVNSLRWARMRTEEWALRDVGWKEMEEGLRRVYARGRREFARAYAQPESERFHEWRKWAKYAWYHAQLLRPVWPPVMEAWAGELDALGELLGQEHDLSVLRQSVVQELDRPIRASTLQLLLELIDDRQGALRIQARRIGSRLYVERPRGFARRMRGYWRAWREERGKGGKSLPEREVPLKERVEGGPELVADCQCEIGEGPLWHPGEKRLYWLDIAAGRIFRYDPASDRHEKCYEGKVVGGFTIQEDGALLLFMEDGAVAVWNGEGELDYVIEGIEAEQGTRFNDVIADPAGRVFCGTLSGAGRPGRLYRLDPDGSLVCLLEGVGCSNGMGFTLDYRGMYYTDSTEKTIYLFDYDPQTGGLSNQRVFVDSRDLEGVPDGLAVDAEGGVWSARWGGGCLIRYTPEGREERRIDLPVSKVSSVTFGGKDYEEMYITTAGGGNRQVEGSRAGGLFRLRIGIAGRPDFSSRIGR